MSLVGSLEDLGLGDILQIVSLARKSGHLSLRTDGDAGRILVADGLVRGAGTKGDPEDLRGLLVGGGEVGEDVFERAHELAARRGMTLEEALQEAADLSKEQLDRLRREHVERAVLRMFSWRNGEFSFDVSEDPEPRCAELLLSTGINTQYLAMEATRLHDEGGLLGDALQGDPPDDEAPMFSGEEPDGFDLAESTQPHDAAVEALALASANGFDEDDVTLDDFDPASAMAGPVEDPAERDEQTDPAASHACETTAPDLGPARGETGGEGATVEVETEAVAAGEAVAVEVRPRRVSVSPPLVALDRDLSGLEWLKLCAGEAFPRVHIFLQGEAGMDRIRRYLMRGVVPLVLLSPELLDPADGSASLLARMRAIAPDMRVLALLGPREVEAPEGFDGSVVRPSRLPPDREQWELQGPLATGLRDALKAARQGAESRPVARPANRSALENLREISDRLRDPARRDDVLSLVLEFASRELSRVAVLQLRHDVAVGIAQCGLPKAGGAGDGAVGGLRFAPEELPALFSRALEERHGVRGRLSPDEVVRLAELLGSGSPGESYVGPIESGGCVAALVYADNLPDGAPIADTTALEIVLHEAGMALDRALLERELAAARARFA